MPFRRAAAFVLTALALLAGTGAASAAPPRRPAQPAGVMVVAKPGAVHVVGRAQAPVKIVEFVSYTCPHCAAFDAEGTDQLIATMVRPGKASIEYRPYLRNPVDIAATLLVNCGPAAKFPGNQSAVLRNQAKWLVQPSDAQQEGWRTGDFATRMRAIAADMNLYPIFAARGYPRAELDRCLANEQLATAIAAQNRADTEALKIAGTPSFLINGKLQDAHDWTTLKAALTAAVR